MRFLPFVLIATSALAQTDGGVADQAPAATPLPEAQNSADVEAMRRELEATKKEMKEMREEVRAQLATQSVAQGWSEDFVEEKRKLELFVPNGYFRVRPELYNKMDLGWAANPLNVRKDPSGYTLWPPGGTYGSPYSNRDRTETMADMRFRFEPTINVSEEVRIRAQVDAFDNMVMGSTPQLSQQGYSIFSQSQVTPQQGLNALTSSIALKRLYGEVSTPVGILRFGRMGSQWGLGMLYNDGSCLDCDHGDNVDRIQFVAEPIAGYYVTPMFDFNLAGVLAQATNNGRQIDTSQSDNSNSLILALARRDTDSQARAKMDAGGTVFNYGIHFTYRTQRNDPVDFYNPTNEGSLLGQTNTSMIGFVPRNAQLFIPDIWVKVERSSLRIELEAAAILGSIGNRATVASLANTPGQNQGLGVAQWGAVLQGEYRLLEGNALSIGVEVGFASGDKAPGFGNYPNRDSKTPNGDTVPGNIDGPQYSCQATGGCTDPTIRNFRFNQDYRVDMLLFREILGGITDTLYVKPSVKYRIADGFHIYAAVIYSRAIYAESTPSAFVDANGKVQGDPNLGVEINAGARYETEDGFFARLEYGVVFPLGGFGAPTVNTLNVPTTTEPAMGLRGMLGIRF
ncbi:MAG: TIGR04551 family protein [Myxococcaceae bacterium]